MLRSIRTYASSAGYRPGLVFKFSRPSPSNPANKGKRTTNSPIMRQVGSQIGKARNFGYFSDPDGYLWKVAAG